MRSIKILIAACVLSGLFITCKKEVAGPKGDQGEPGPGNTVIYNSGDITVTSSSWVIDTTSSTFTAWRNVIYSDMINSNVVAKGSLRVMIKVDQAWWELPYIYEGDNFTTFGYQEGMIRLLNHEGHGSPARPATALYRFITTSPM